MKIKIYIKSYYVPYLNKFIEKLQKYLSKDLNIIKTQIFLPIKIEKYTVLRSPHADKKARDQFERKTHKRLIILNLPGISEKNIFSLDCFFQMLQTFAIGIEFRIQYESKSKTT